MRISPKFSAVYYRLIFSYIALITITALLLGSLSYYYFSTNFNEEITKVNQAKLEHIANITEETIFQKAEQFYTELAFNEFQHQEMKNLFETTPADMNTQISAVYQSTRSLITLKADYLLSIEIYFARHDMVLSTDSGVKYLDQQGSKAWITFPWLAYKDTLSRVAWLHEGAPDGKAGSPSGTGAVMLLGPYPSFPTSEGVLGTIAFRIRTEAIQRLIGDSDGSEAGKVLLVSDKGILTSNHPLPEPALYDSIVREVIDSAEPRGNSIAQLHGQKHMITYTSLNGLNWKLVDITRIDDYYRKSDAVFWTLLWLCVLAIVVGLILSNLFTRSIYHPLKKITETVRQLFDPPSKAQPAHTGNEYVYLNNVFSHLSIKVRDLEETIRHNKPLIQNQLLIGLIHRTIKSDKELQDRLSLLGLTPLGENYVCILFEIRPKPDEHLDTETNQFILYKVIEFIESKSNSRRLCMAIPHTDDRVVAIVNSDQPSKTMEAFAEEVLHHAHDRYMTEMTASIGAPAQALLMHQSYKTAKRQLQYSYFMPDTRVLAPRLLEGRDDSTLELPERYLRQFEKHVKSGQLDDVDRTLQALFHEMRTGLYSYEHCEQKLTELVLLYHQYLKSLNRSSNDILNASLREEFRTIRHVGQFHHWLLRVVGETLRSLRHDADRRTQAVIEEVKKYIQENLELELSLNAVADQVILNPNYLSRLFKDETGVNFVDYVNMMRIEASKTLILQNKLTIEEISRRVGFNSSTYFIKKFKETVGMTPRIYKLRHLQSGNHG